MFPHLRRSLILFPIFWITSSAPAVCELTVIIYGATFASAPAILTYYRVVREVFGARYDVFPATWATPKFSLLHLRDFMLLPLPPFIASYALASRGFLQQFLVSPPFWARRHLRVCGPKSRVARHRVTAAPVPLASLHDCAPWRALGHSYIGAALAQSREPNYATFQEHNSTLHLSRLHCRGQLYRAGGLCLPPWGVLFTSCHFCRSPILFMVLIFRREIDLLCLYCNRHALTYYLFFY